MRGGGCAGSGCVVGWFCSGVVVWWGGCVVEGGGCVVGWLCGSVALKLHRVNATIIILLLY